MNNYSYDEIMKMQNDAVRRVEEMQKKAREAAGLNEKTEYEKTYENTREAPRRIPMPPGYLTGNNSEKTNINKSGNENSVNNYKYNTKNIGSVLDFLKSDSDISLILSLVLLLWEEHADETLILSLLYILT